MYTSWWSLIWSVFPFPTNSSQRLFSVIAVAATLVGRPFCILLLTVHHQPSRALTFTKITTCTTNHNRGQSTNKKTSAAAVTMKQPLHKAGISFNKPLPSSSFPVAVISVKPHLSVVKQCLIGPEQSKYQ